MVFILNLLPSSIWGAIFWLGPYPSRFWCMTYLPRHRFSFTSPPRAQHCVSGFDLLYPALPIIENLPFSWLLLWKKYIQSSTRISASVQSKTLSRGGPQPGEGQNLPEGVHLLEFQDWGSLAPKLRPALVLRGKIPSQSSVSFVVFPRKLS